MMINEKLQKIIDEEKQKDREKEKQQSVFEMLKDNIKLEKILLSIDSIIFD